MKAPGSVLLFEQRFFRFLMAGGVAAICNYGSRFLYSTIVDFSVAVVLAFLTGLTVGFLLNRSFVFNASRNTMAQQVGLFIMVNLFALAQTWLVSVYLAQYLVEEIPAFAGANRSWAEAIAHGAGVLLPVFTSYVGHKYLTFRE